jgi:predicted RNA-binding Zn-ribbon protein involved in translation (DUF1610 family)
METNNYQFFCDNCCYKRITNGKDIQDLIEVKTSTIPKGSPKIDPLTKKVVVPPPLKQIRKFKCPKCGHIIKARKITFVEHKKEDEQQTNWSNGSEAGIEGPSIS